MQRDWQRAFFQPEVEMIESTRLHLNDDFVRSGTGVWEFTQFKLSWLPMRDKLDGLHADIQHPKTESDKQPVEPSNKE